MARLRLMLTKGEEVRYISHLDYAKAVERALRRSRLPVAYSEGFNPHLKISFASALAVGVTSDAEYLDVELTREVELEKVRELLAPSFGNGIKMRRASYINKRSPALTALINLASYEAVVSLPQGVTPASVNNSVDKFNAAASVLFIKKSPKGERQVDIKEFLAGGGIKVYGDNGQNGRLVLQMSVKITPQGSVKPADILGAIADVYQMPVDRYSFLINRTGLYIEKDNIKISPLDGE